MQLTCIIFNRNNVPTVHRSRLVIKSEVVNDFLLFQIITVGGVTMALFATGNILGFSSFTIPELLSSESKIKATQDDLSWIGKMYY